MDIKIEAPNHPNQVQLTAFYRKKIEQKYGVYDFVKAMDVKINQDTKSTFKVSLQCKPEKGTLLFAADSNRNENKAFTEAMRKLNIQIEKYKEVHYHSH